MAKQLKIMTVCGFGTGTSLILKMKVDQMLKENNIKGHDVFPQDVTNATSIPCDLVFTSAEIHGQLVGRVKAPMIVVNNFLSVEEIKEKGLATVIEMMEA